MPTATSTCSCRDVSHAGGSGERPQLVRHLPSRSGADRAWFDRHSHDVDDEPRHGGRTGIAGDAARYPRRSASLGATAAATSWAWLRCWRLAYPLDCRWDGRARARRHRRRNRHGLDGDQLHCRRRSGGCLVPVDRRRQWSNRDFAAGTARQAGQRRTPCRRGDDRVDDDDCRLHLDVGAGRPLPRSVLAAAPGGGDRGQGLLGLRAHPGRRGGRGTPACCARSTCRHGAASLPSGAGAGLGRSSGAAVHHFRLRLDACLQRAGSDPGAVCRNRVRLHAG